MSLDRASITQIAHLARLAIPEDQVARYSQELSTILTLADQLLNLDTATLAPMAHPINASQRLRDDIVTGSDQHLLFQSIAPAIAHDLYIVPLVIE